MSDKRLKRPAWQLLSKARERAAKQNLPFDITEEDIVIPKHCPILDIEIIPNHGGKRAVKNSPTLDRIIPELGYVKNNIQVISFKANTMKNDASITELKQFAKWVDSI